MTTPRTPIKLLDRPVPGWFVLDVMREKERGRDRCALMIDVDPDDFIHRRRELRSDCCWVRIPGKHRNRDAAWDVLEEMMATRH